MKNAQVCITKNTKKRDDYLYKVIISALIVDLPSPLDLSFVFSLTSDHVWCGEVLDDLRATDDLLTWDRLGAH